MADVGVLDWLPALFGGVVLGAAFYGGLWWTVRRGLPSSQPALWFAISIVLRTSIALAGIYLIGGGHRERLATCLVGFVAARTLVARLTRPAIAVSDGQRS